MFKWQVRWTRLVIALSSIAAFVIASGAGWRWNYPAPALTRSDRMSEQVPHTGYPPRLRLLIASALALALPVVAGAAVSSPSAARDRRGARRPPLLRARAPGRAEAGSARGGRLSTSRSRSSSSSRRYPLRLGVRRPDRRARAPSSRRSSSASPSSRTAFNAAVYSLVRVRGGASGLRPRRRRRARPAHDHALRASSAARRSSPSTSPSSRSRSRFTSGCPLLPLLKDDFASSGPAFAILAFLAALAAALWATDPRLLVLMAGPLSR